LNLFIRQQLNKITFICPDYNKAEYYNMEYKFKSSKITVEEVSQRLNKDFETEHKFLSGVAQALTTLLNNKGIINSILPFQIDLESGKIPNFLSTFFCSALYWPAPAP